MAGVVQLDFLVYSSGIILRILDRA